VTDQAPKNFLANRFFFSKGERASDEYDQYWIRYKPMRVLKKRFQTEQYLKTAAAWICLSLVLILGSVCGPLVGLAAACVFLSAFLFFRLRLLLFPTHIALTEDGITFHWLRSWLNFQSCLLPWSSLSHVNLTTAKFLKHEESRVEFNIVSVGMPLSQRLPFLLLTPALAKGWLSDRSKIILPLDGLASSDDRKRLQFGFQRFLPTYRVDPKVSDELQLSLKVESYTDLWLGALSMNRNRLRRDTLPQGAIVNHGRYEVVSPIGSGGQAVVYSAIQKEMSLDRPVVLKEFVLPSYAGVKVRKRVLENIQSESKILKDLQHPNIVKLLDFFVEDERAYLVLEQIKGRTLKQQVEQDGPFKEVDALSFALQMTSILTFLHNRKPQVVHRDFTPDNLMVGHGDILKLIDFNVAQHLESMSTHTVVGKHSYIPPEQFRGEASPQSDIYAMGATLFFLLSGKDPEPISVSHVKSARMDVSDELDAIVAKATATDSAYRYADCAEIKSELEALRKQRYGH
jgi:tRNA A-37 threonylcarbamoyl transferase component Bud32